MNLRQKVLKAIYPVFLFMNKITGSRSNVVSNESKIMAPSSFYDLTVQLNNGQQLKLNSLKGKKVMLVNTASECGYTAQYADLQKLYEAHREKLVIIGFPANDFGQQEKGSNDQIEEFCRVNFGVTFPLAQKSTVVASDQQNDIFQWLTRKDRNGWNMQPPTWNFSKYLVNEEGVLTHYFDPAVSPMSDEVRAAVQG